MLVGGRIDGLVAEAAALLERDPDAPPGQRLARIPAIAAVIARAPSPESVATLWLESAATLVLACDRYEGVDDHRQRWHDVREQALDLARVQRIVPGPGSPTGLLRALGETASAFAGGWLDELTGRSRVSAAALLVDELVLLAARAVVAAQRTRSSGAPHGGEMPSGEAWAQPRQP